MKKWAWLLGLFWLAACGAAKAPLPVPEANTLRIISLDYCADQYVMKLVDREKITALSPDATASFSYLRNQAKDMATVRPRAEDILLLAPDIVVRTYGGGPNATIFFERAGIKVIQIGYANDITTIKEVILDVAKQLYVPEKGHAIVAQMDARLNALPVRSTDTSVLYLTSKGATAGTNTLIDDVIQSAGLRNFQTASGWRSLPLEELAYQHPDKVAVGFFETNDLITDQWTPTRHPVVQRMLADTPVIDIPGAVTACGAWFLLDAAEALTAMKRGQK